MKNQNSRAYNFLKRGCGDRTLDTVAVAALLALDVDGDTPINDILDIIRNSEIRSKAVGPNKIGQANSTLH